MFYNLKISSKLIIGFLTVALLVGVVGVFAISSNKTIQKNNEIRLGLIELTNILDHSLIQTLALIESQDLDEYKKIKTNIENLRKDFDVLHEKNDKILHQFEQAETFDKDINRFIKVSNGIIALHKEKLIQNREFMEKKERGRPAEELAEIIVEQNRIEKAERITITQLKELINVLQENEKIIVGMLLLKSESVARNTIILLLIVILIAVIGSIVLGLFISSSISKPIGNLSRTAQIIAGGDLTKRAEVKYKDEIGDLAMAFNKMVDKLKERTEELIQEKIKVEKIAEMKSDFVSMASHQLKTPSAQIKGFIDNMLSGLTGPLNKKQKEYLNDMFFVADRNSKLIDDLLNVSRLERGMIEADIKNVQIKKILKLALSSLRNIAKKNKVKIKEIYSEKELYVLADFDKSVEIIRNVIHNAIKFTKPSTFVIIKTYKDKDNVVVSIKDEGEGITPENQKTLFNKEKVLGGKVRSSGAGLGLYLAKKFTDLQGGKITFETKPGSGTTFYIHFKQKYGKNI